MSFENFPVAWEFNHKTVVKHFPIYVFHVCAVQQLKFWICYLSLLNFMIDYQFIYSSYGLLGSAILQKDIRFEKQLNLPFQRDVWQLVLQKWPHPHLNQNLAISIKIWRWFQVFLTIFLNNSDLYWLRVNSFYISLPENEEVLSSTFENISESNGSNSYEEAVSWYSSVIIISLSMLIAL